MGTSLGQGQKPDLEIRKTTKNIYAQINPKPNQLELKNQYIYKEKSQANLLETNLVKLTNLNYYGKRERPDLTTDLPHETQKL